MTAQLLMSLSLLVLVHEWGHFIAARSFNIRVEKFYLFFDFLFPMANLLNFSLLKFKKGDTEYGVGWFPLGGYVKIAGMVDESMDKEALKEPPKPWEFRSKKPWQRLIVMLGGVLVNVVVGVIIFIGITYFVGDSYLPKDYVNANGGIVVSELGEKLGLKTGDRIIDINGKNFDDFGDILRPNALLANNSYYTVIRDEKTIKVEIPGNFIENLNQKKSQTEIVSYRIPTLIVGISDETEIKTPTNEGSKSNESGKAIKIESIAKKVGLKTGDRVVELQGQPVSFKDQMDLLIKNKKLDSISFKIARGGEILSFKENFEGRDLIGVTFQGISKNELAVINYGFAKSIVVGSKRAFQSIIIQMKAFKKIFSGELSLSKSLSGPIGMAQAFGAEWNWHRFWSLTGLLSMVLAFMNLLPIPGLDGGYVMFLLYEMITGREASEKVSEIAIKIGMAILLILMVFVFYNDIVKVFN